MAWGAGRLLSHYGEAGAPQRAYGRIRWWICPFDRVLPAVPAEGTLLDVGCGAGLWLTYLALQRPELRLEGLEPDSRKLEIARTSDLPTPIFHKGSALELPDGPYDCITIFDVLYLMPDAEKHTVLERCYRALAPGGRLVVKELDTRPWWKYAPSAFEEFLAVRVAGITQGNHLHFQPSGRLVSALESAGFNSVCCERVDRWYPHPHVLVTGAR
jgi:2-polyprenyl-3-methyl-5-hydroxy-6-metoxy-1,4-benzoquinol methylase